MLSFGSAMSSGLDLLTPTPPWDADCMIRMHLVHASTDVGGTRSPCRALEALRLNARFSGMTRTTALLPGASVLRTGARSQVRSAL